MLKRTYIDDPLSGRQRVGRSLKPPLVGVVTVQRSRMWAVATLWVAGSCCCVKAWKSRICFSSVLTCLPLIKTFCVSLRKLHGLLFTIFTVYIVSVFLTCFYNGCACDRFSAWSCSLKRAVYRLYISFIHSRHNAKDRSLGVCRDIILEVAADWDELSSGTATRYTAMHCSR